MARTKKAAAKRQTKIVKTCLICDNKNCNYKCPTCERPYCSISCYKAHKVQPCNKIEKKVIRVPVVKEKNKFKNTIEEEEFLPISQERLSKLKNDSMEQKLESMRLREILTTINESGEKNMDLLQHYLKKDDEFQHFTNLLLEIIE